MMLVLDVRRLKPSSIQPLSHLLIQTCSVSGTAKGKAKGKAAAAPLKRSKVTTKKGKSPEDASEKGEGGRRHNQYEEMVDSCLVATSPVRHLKPKEREREAERERMGLISKARAKEIETFKKTKSEKPDQGLFMGPPGFDPISLGLVDEDKLVTYELTVEDGRRLAKEYSRFLMRRHRARQAAESNLLRLKKEAVEALPEGLREAALVPDLAPFPVNRFMATLTPPIEGYIEKVNEAARKSAGKEKLR